MSYQSHVTIRYVISSERICVIECVCGLKCAASPYSVSCVEVRTRYHTHGSLVDSKAKLKQNHLEYLTHLILPLSRAKMQ